MADIGIVDALARLQLTARRCGCRIEIASAPADVLELIELAGLTETLVQTGRKPEQREERLGVEEERELDDPVV